MTTPEPEFNCTQISFPSDGLTIGKLRHLHPGDFDHMDSDYVAFFPPGGQPPTGNIAMGDMLHNERRLAQIAFESTLIGLSGELEDPELENEINEERRKCTDDLIEAYQRFGIATGPESSRELIRRFCDLAAEQASRHSKGKAV